MISRNGQNFFAQHYDWLVAGLGILVLILGAAFYAVRLGVDADQAANEAASRIVTHRAKGETGVEKEDLTPFTAAARAVRQPTLLTEVADAKESFLASERRIRCSCGKILVQGLQTCPGCGKSLVIVNKVDEEAKKVALWEKRFGVKLDDSDSDNDGFTNREEYLANTDPSNAKDHKDYLDSLTLQLPLKSTPLSFIFRQANKIPAGYRLTFFDATAESATDRRKKGANVTALVGEEISKTGYRVKDYTPKTEKRAKSGIGGTVDVDVSEVTVENIKNKKILTLVVQPKGFNYAEADITATLVYTRGTARQLDVIVGSEIDLNGTKFKILSIRKTGKGAEVVLENSLSGKKRTLKALE